MHGSGSMHSKLQLLKFPGYLRLVVPTGNMVPYDWGETGVLENVSTSSAMGYMSSEANKVLDAIYD